MTIKVLDGSTIKEPTQIFVKGDAATVFGVNYVVVKKDDGSLSTAWSAVYETSRDTSTVFGTVTAFDTTTSYKSRYDYVL